MSNERPQKSRKKRSREEEILLSKLAIRLRELRQKEYPSIEAFAYENMLSRAQVGRYEVGVDMQILSLYRVLKALNISLKEFFSDGFEGL